MKTMGQLPCKRGDKWVVVVGHLLPVYHLAQPTTEAKFSIGLVAGPVLTLSKAHYVGCVERGIRFIDKKPTNS